MRCLLPHNPLALLLRLCGCACAALLLLPAMHSAAQTQTPPVHPVARAHRPAHPRKRPAAAKPTPAVATLPVVAISVPLVPEAPAWPINDKPAPASVTWDSQGLHIAAANSSLEQILNDVSTATGAKVEGLDKDQRVFGDFGPGQARDVLSQLLHGSGYNVVMIGDQGQGTPRRILLSSPHPGGATPTATPTQDNDEDSDVEEPQQTNPPPFRPGFQPGRGSSPQQMQELERRQQMMQQRIPPEQQPQQQQPENPQN